MVCSGYLDPSVTSASGLTCTVRTWGLCMGCPGRFFDACISHLVLLKLRDSWYSTRGVKGTFGVMGHSVLTSCLQCLSGVLCLDTLCDSLHCYRDCAILMDSGVSPGVSPFRGTWSRTLSFYGELCVVLAYIAYDLMWR